MPDGNLQIVPAIWTGVGVHPTPSSIVRGFARAVAARVAHLQSRDKRIGVLDACAGDGRLGHAVAKRLYRLGFSVQLTLVEADSDRLLKLDTPYPVNYVQADFYSFEPADLFDVVVSNPPYLALSKSQSAGLGLEWREVIKGGRNLYGLALAKCLSIARPSGVVALIAPQGWLQNSRGSALRELVHRKVKRLDVYASRNRRLFPGVHQDVAAQLFELRNAAAEGSIALVRISYDDAELVAVADPLANSAASELIKSVRVGPFVWNREKERIAKIRRGLPVVYGGNISPTGALNFDARRYHGRQFLTYSRVPPSYVSAAPCILVRRTMRGSPGNWKLDTALVSDDLQFVGENHVIIVELVAGVSEEDMSSLRSTIAAQVERYHHHHGHPNVSVGLLKRALGL